MRSWERPDGRCFVLGDPDDELPPGELYAFVDAFTRTRSTGTACACSTTSFARTCRHGQLALDAGGLSGRDV